MRHEFISSTNWMDLRSVQDLRAKDKDVYNSAIKIYVTFDEDGKPDMSKLPFDMSIPNLQRNALLSRIVLDWSFSVETHPFKETPSPLVCSCGRMMDHPIHSHTEGGRIKLPVPYWEGDHIGDAESIDDLPLDEWNEIEELLEPYIEKCRRRPDPKKTTTDASSVT